MNLFKIIIMFAVYIFYTSYCINKIIPSVLNTIAIEIISEFFTSICYFITKSQTIKKYL